MPSLKVSMLDAFGDFRTSGLGRPAAEKFAGAWLACFLVMARGNIFAAFTFEHASLASICGIVSAAVTVGLLVQMDRTTDSVSRQDHQRGGDVRRRYLRAPVALSTAMGGADDHG